nr:caspase recruitment domain-containing protein 11-like [Lytechinus pictus]
MDPKWEDDLEEHRYELTRVLRPDRYFDKFRSERLLDESDTQIINNETKYPTRDKKAGQFLDIVRLRGPDAYKLLIECLEADHPEVYKSITGNEPEPKAWTIGLSKTCSCECHEDHISLDLMNAYKKEKQQNISLRKELEKLAKSVDKVRGEKLKLKHENETMKKKLDVLQSETRDRHKLEEDIQWKRLQICDLQAKAYETQTQLMAANDKLRKVNLENNSLENKCREANTKLRLQRKKSTRLEQERSTDRLKDGDTLRALVEHLQELGLGRKKIEDSYVPPIENDLHDQTKLEIIMADKQEAVTKCEEVVNELVKVRKQLYEVQEAKTKFQAENEELDTITSLLTEERDMVMDRLQMAQEELTQVSSERSQAISERNRAFEETALSMLERDDLVKKLNNERQSYLNQTRKLFDLKSKVQRLKREKRLLLQERSPSLISSGSMDGSNDSKRSSGVTEVSSIEDGNTATSSSDTAKLTTMTTATEGSSPAPLESKRSISINDRQYSVDYDSDLADYEYPVGPMKRNRSLPVSEIPEALRGRVSSNATSSDRQAASRHEERDSGFASSVDKFNECTDGVLDSLPCDVGGEKVETLWSDFDYTPTKDGVERTSDAKPVERRLMRSGTSVDVHPGSLKDKNRAPGPRLSSFEIRPSNYMSDVKIDRRSKTLGSDPDDPDQVLLPSH